MTPVFGYVRVSSSKQLDGDGPERQKEQIARYCAAKGFFVQRWFVDDVTGTAAAKDREQYGEMLLLMGEATTLTVIVERADRLARDLIVSELAIQAARERKIQILEAASDTNLTDSSDPTRVVIRQVLGALAEWNKSTMVKRLQEARVRVRAKGHRCEGRKPFAERSETDAETFSLILNLRKAGRSLGEIQRALNEQKRRLPQGGTHWYRSSVAKLIKTHEERERAKTSAPKKELLSGLNV